MNDLTKDELEIIWNCVNLYTDHPSDPYLPLLDKIQCLIDNYHEHDWGDPIICIDDTLVRNCNVCGVWK